jgi:hypothetical protein
MHILSIFFLTLVGLTTAGPVRRDLATVEAAFANITTALKQFDTDVNALNASSNVSTSVATLSSDANNVLAALNTGTTNVDATSPLSLIDAINLASVAQGLGTTVNTTINDLIAKQPIINAAGNDPLVVSELQAQYNATQAFINAVASKVPSDVSGIAEQDGQTALNSINNGIVAFGGTAQSKKFKRSR